MFEANALVSFTLMHEEIINGQMKHSERGCREQPYGDYILVFKHCRYQILTGQ